ncbi:hypothetical protein HK405_004333, partial [Cladochytrium tenue]
VCERLLELTFRALFGFRFLQTDPNWTNFLYEPESDTLYLLDFGAAREFHEEFTGPYLQLLRSAAEGDRAAVADWSVRLGFLTGLESELMTSTHVDSVLALAEPFTAPTATVGAGGADAVYDFGAQTVTGRVRAAIPVMLRERLTPPPAESYSLHRLLSGLFLLCARLRARVPARRLFFAACDEFGAAAR